jgi:NTP pyrophosphatase (non-canonical NTP hydrolase)
VNAERLAEWEGDTKVDAMFHATELGGEVGELLNVIKKLHREAMGWRGSRAAPEDLPNEIGDVLICLDKLAAHFGIDLATATANKFNITSEKVGLPQRLAAIPAQAIEARRAETGTGSVHESAVSEGNAP